jgi:hypothetical protein
LLIEREGGDAKMRSFKMMKLMGRNLMQKTLSCKQVTHELSNYLDETNLILRCEGGSQRI